MTYAEIPRPSSLDDDQWSAVCRLVDRVERAARDSDWELVVGSGKELCEAVAKIVLDARGETTGSDIDYPQLISGAHVALARQPGHELSGDQPVRNMAQAAKTLALAIGQLRNTYGTGHGRPRTPDVVAEHAQVTVDGALLWIKWALRRLDVIVDGRASDIVRDLRESTFHRGDLARRLVAANVPLLDPTEQHRLGVAVGQRASRATFNVLEDGGQAAIQDGPWTEHYRTGVVEGAFIDVDGHLRATIETAQAALDLLLLLGDRAAKIIARVADQAAQAPASYALSPEDREAIADLLDAATERVTSGVARDLGRLATHFRPSTPPS